MAVDSPDLTLADIDRILEAAEGPPIERDEDGLVLHGAQSINPAWKLYRKDLQRQYNLHRSMMLENIAKRRERAAWGLQMLAPRGTSGLL